MNGMNEGMRPSLFDQLGGGDGQDDLDWFEEMKASGTRDGGTEERSRRRRARSRTDGHGIAMAETDPTVPETAPLPMPAGRATTGGPVADGSMTGPERPTIPPGSAVPSPVSASEDADGVTNPPIGPSITPTVDVPLPAGDASSITPAETCKGMRESLQAVADHDDSADGGPARAGKWPHRILIAVCVLAVLLTGLAVVGGKVRENALLEASRHVTSSMDALKGANGKARGILGSYGSDDLSDPDLLDELSAQVKTNRVILGTSHDGLDAKRAESLAGKADTATKRTLSLNGKIKTSAADRKRETASKKLQESLKKARNLKSSVKSEDYVRKALSDLDKAIGQAESLSDDATADRIDRVRARLDKAYGSVSTLVEEKRKADEQAKAEADAKAKAEQEEQARRQTQSQQTTTPNTRPHPPAAISEARTVVPVAAPPPDRRIPGTPADGAYPHPKPMTACPNPIRACERQGASHVRKQTSLIDTVPGPSGARMDHHRRHRRNADGPRVQPVAFHRWHGHGVRFRIIVRHLVRTPVEKGEERDVGTAGGHDVHRGCGKHRRRGTRTAQRPGGLQRGHAFEPAVPSRPSGSRGGERPVRRHRLRKAGGTDPCAGTAMVSAGHAGGHRRETR